MRTFSQSHTLTDWNHSTYVFNVQPIDIKIKSFVFQKMKNPKIEQILGYTTKKIVFAILPNYVKFSLTFQNPAYCPVLTNDNIFLLR